MTAPTSAPHEIDLTPRPAVDEVVIPPPAAWVARVAEMAELDGMPPLRMAPADAWQSNGRWVLHPWWLLHDITALLMWAQHLDDGTEPQAQRIGGQHGGVIVYGQIAGHPTALVGHSWRLALDTTPRPPYALPMESLVNHAGRETRSADTSPQAPQPLRALGRVEWRAGLDGAWQPADLCSVLGERGRSLCMLLIRLDVDGRTELVPEHSTRPLDDTPTALDVADADVLPPAALFEPATPGAPPDVVAPAAPTPIFNALQKWAAP